MMTNIDEEIDQVVSRKWPAEIDQRSKSSSEEWRPKIKKYWPEDNLQQQMASSCNDKPYYSRVDVMSSVDDMTEMSCV